MENVNNDRIIDVVRALMSSEHGLAANAIARSISAGNDKVTKKEVNRILYSTENNFFKRTRTGRPLWVVDPELLPASIARKVCIPDKDLREESPEGYIIYFDLDQLGNVYKAALEYMSHGKLPINTDIICFASKGYTGPGSAVAVFPTVNATNASDNELLFHLISVSLSRRPKEHYVIVSNDGFLKSTVTVLKSKGYNITSVTSLEDLTSYFD